MIQKIVLSLCLSLMSAGLVQAQQTPIEEDMEVYKQLNAPLPAFKMESPDGKLITEKDIPEGNALVVLFNPTCEHCQDLAKDLVKHREEFAAYPIVFIAAKDMKPYLEDFITQTGLKQLPQLLIGADRSEVIYQLYEFKALPQVNIYTAAHRLMLKHNGSISAAELLPVISQTGH